MTAALQLLDYTVALGDLQILKGVDLSVPFGEVHALMGPNGSGKSTLSHALMGKQDYTTTGTALVGGVDLEGLDVHERARAGVFQAFQYPVEIPGVRLEELVAAMKPDGEDNGFDDRVERVSQRLRMDPYVRRPVNVGLSGGEKKRSEMFQLAVSRPRVAILDEIDSGLDVDAVREVAELVETLRSPDLGVLIITHYSRILRYMSPDRVHVLVGGRIVQSGGPEVAEALEKSGYDEWRQPGGAVIATDPLADL